MDDSNDVTICRVINSVDKKLIILTTHWCEEYVKLNIIKSDDLPLEGQITKAKLAEPAENYEKTPEDYLQEMRRELAGKDNEVQFSLQNNTLTWKRKIWKRPSIKCEPLSDIISYSNLIHGILVCKSSVEENEIKYREENETLKRTISDMESALTTMTSIKNKMEDALYRKFLFILKTKKNMIRNLQDEIKKLTNSVYDKSTDVSDNEENNEVEFMTPKKRKKMDNLLLESKEELPVKTKSRVFNDRMFDIITKTIERENSLVLSEEKMIADLTNNNDDCSNDSDINLRYEDSQIIVE
ncbi:GSCOCG00001551001-RA-CDS [Cotesia congregata]|nr:GSCOCG00001551001-RA-CDS [Cotesia congregata]